MKYVGRLLVVIILAVCFSTVASAQGADSLVKLNDSKNVAKLFPESPPEMWARILILLKHERGFTPKQIVEEALGVLFTHSETEDEKLSHRLGAQFLHSFDGEVQNLGHLSVSLFDDTKKTMLSLRWGPELEEQKNCLRLDRVTNDLREIGWFPAARTVMPGRGSQSFYREEDWNEYRKTGRSLDTFSGSSELILIFPNQSSRCVNGVTTHIWL
jgi:hypothetical protein